MSSKFLDKPPGHPNLQQAEFSTFGKTTIQKPTSKSFITTSNGV